MQVQCAQGGAETKMSERTEGPVGQKSNKINAAQNREVKQEYAQKPQKSPGPRLLM